MNNSTSTHEPGKRSVWRILIGGCGVLLLLILCAFALNTLYWMNRVGVFA